MKHMATIDPSRGFCALEFTIEEVGEGTRIIYRDIDCADCLQKAIAEADERGRVLRELLEALVQEEPS